MRISDTGLPVSGWVGSRSAVKRNPLSTNSATQLAMVRKYQGGASWNRC